MPNYVGFDESSDQTRFQVLPFFYWASPLLPWTANLCLQLWDHDGHGAVTQPGCAAVLHLGSTRLPGPSCGNKLLGAGRAEEEVEGMKGERGFLNLQMFSHGGVSQKLTDLMRASQRCNRGCLQLDSQVSFAKAGLNLYHRDTNFSSLWSQLHMSPRAVGLGNESQKGLYPALSGTHLLSKFEIIFARNREIETYATSLFFFFN